MRQPLVEAVRHWPTVAGFLAVGIVGTVVGAVIRAALDDGYDVTALGLLPTAIGWIVGVLVAVAAVRRLAPSSGPSQCDGET